MSDANAAERQLPKHIAIIMDGNGRWAKKRFLPRIAGHKVGVETVRKIIRYCAKLDIQVLSLFAFSSENWRRPGSEVSFLMELFFLSLEREVKELHSHQIQIRFIGNRDRFSERLRNKITEVESLTRNNQGMVLIIAADYGGQWDICESVKRLALQVKNNEINPADINPTHIVRGLSFADLPDPDLFIRTSGELRISNFMLWQLAYTELYFTDTHWPDFNEKELDKALNHYAQRERRFGLSSEQLGETICSNNASSQH